MKKRLISIILILALTAFLAGCGESSKELASVNGMTITQSDLDQYLPFFMGMLGGTMEQVTDALKEQAIEDLVTMKVISQSYADLSDSILPSGWEEEFKAYEEGVRSDEQNDQFLKQNNISSTFLKELYADQEYMGYFFEEVIKPEVLAQRDAAELRYEADKEEFLLVRASHILLGPEDKELAEDVLERAKAGEDFSELALEYSIDTVANQNGGDLDYFGNGKMVAEFWDVASVMETGEIKGLVETQFGYHIIYVTDKKYLTFDEAFAEDGSLYAEFFDKVYQETMEELKKNMKIEYK